ncbi:MAG TPA: carbohydrate porin [Burkholderiales bacterium]|nr:carbohydrate porin [Burkholderiales bacterium]
MRPEPILLGVLAIVALGVPGAARADGAGEEAYGAKLQATYVWQRKYPFGAAYTGANSLIPDIEKSYSFTATAALGARPWKGGEVYVDPEVAQGVPLSRLTGLGGFTNGEIARTTGPNATFYVARAFLRQTWGLGGVRAAVESDANQLAGSADSRRLALTAGKLSLQDLFDDNAYGHDPRTQFLNWSLMTHGAWDFAADARGYSWGAALEYFDGPWALRAARFMMPKESNGLALNPRIFASFGDQIELEHAHALGGRPGRLRVLAYRNQADMGGYRDSIADGVAIGATPDLATSRRRRVKYGFGVNLEQSASPSAGVFARASWNNGEAEEFAFTEIDRSVSAGLLIKGTAWSRASDSLGVAVASNAISQPHRDYLAAGGLGFFIGDGKLSYRAERIFEAFYSAAVAKEAWLSADFQRIFDPAYNADRGPVNVASARFHYGF